MFSLLLLFLIRLLQNVLLITDVPVLPCLHLQTDQPRDPAAFWKNIQMVGVQQHLLHSTSPVFQTPWPSGEHAGQVRTRCCLQLPSSLSTSLCKISLQLSFSLAFCQFSRLSNDLSDRSKPPGWDLGSVRKLGMPQWRLWRLHGNMQWIICPCIYWTDCLPVNQSEYVLSGNLSVLPMTEVKLILKMFFFFKIGSILGDKRSLMRHFCTLLLREQ